MNNLLIGILILILLAYCFSGKENFVEIFAPAGYSKPVSSPSINFDANFDDSEFILANDTSGITYDQANECIQPIISFVKSQTNLCTSPVEMNKMDVYVNSTGQKLFKCRLMLMVTSVGFPFGFEIIANVFNGKVVLANSQVVDIPTNIAPYSEMSETNFLPLSNLVPKPNLSI